MSETLKSRMYLRRAAKAAALAVSVFGVLVLNAKLTYTGVTSVAFFPLSEPQPISFWQHFVVTSLFHPVISVAFVGLVSLALGFYILRVASLRLRREEGER